VGPAALGGRGRAVDRRPHQWVPEAHSPVDLQQARVLGGCGGRDGDAQALRGAPQQERVTERLGRRDEQQSAGLAGKLLDSPVEQVLDGTRARCGHPESAGQPGRGRHRRKLEQGQRVAPRLRDDPIAHLLVQRRTDRRGEQGARLGLGQWPDRQAGQRVDLERTAGLAYAEQHRDALVRNPPGGERQGPRRRPVQPLRVVDDAQHRRVLRGVGQQRQGGQTDQEGVRRRSNLLPEAHLQRLPLRAGQAVEPVEQRCTQLVHPREGQLHLELGAGGAQQPHIAGARHGIVDQCGLADAGLAAHHDRTATPGSRGIQQLGQCAALSRASEQHAISLAPTGEPRPVGTRGSGRDQDTAKVRPAAASRRSTSRPPSSEPGVQMPPAASGPSSTRPWTTSVTMRAEDR
jgi:hypothetical protein